MDETQGLKSVGSSFPLDCLTVYELKNDKIRIGKDHDGGYVIAEGFAYDALIGCGISTDNSFESQFLDRYNTVCYAFDGTIDRLDQPDSRIEFFKKNISGVNNDKETNLHDLILQYRDVFVKMDIEGGEYRWIQSLGEEHLDRLRQIVMELHRPFKKDWWRCIQKLNQTHYLCHLHPNNNCGTRTIEGTVVPNVFECTYVRKSDIDYTPKRSLEKIPSGLDMRNALHKEDIILDGYPWHRTVHPSGY